MSGLALDIISAITAVPDRQNTLLPQTLQSLEAAGFNKLVLFMEGLNVNLSLINNYEMVMHRQAVGHLPNWMGALFYLYTVYPRSAFYAVFEDDLVACRNLKQYILEGGYPSDGYLNLLTHNENLCYTGNDFGWHKSNQRGRGAVGLVFSRKLAGELLTCPHFVNRPASVRRPAADGMVIDTLKPMGYYEYVHYPSLVQHKGGGQSTMGHRYGEMSGFGGEDYDPLEELRQATQPTSQGST